MLTEAICPLVRVNVPDLIVGRFWVIPEGHRHPEMDGAEFALFTDPSRRYVDCTDGVCRLLGYQRSEMLARSIENVSFHDGEVSKLFAEYLRRGKMDGEFALRQKDGSPRTHPLSRVCI